MRMDATNPIFKADTEARVSKLMSPAPALDNEAADSLVFSCHQNAFPAYY